MFIDVATFCQGLGFPISPFCFEFGRPTSHVIRVRSLQPTSSSTMRAIEVQLFEEKTWTFVDIGDIRQLMDKISVNQFGEVKEFP